MIVNVEDIYGKKEGKNALVAEIPTYVKMVVEKVETEKEVILTGAGPVWLYLVLAHALHGKTALLMYDSPVTGPIIIHDHRS